MAQTSIHLRPCKASSEIHNKREKELDYVRTDLTSMNEWWSGVASLGELRSQISALVKEKTGRKMQAKAEPLREGVVVIQESTTMQQLHELGTKFKERFGVNLVQIAIHRDEGHWVDSEGKGTGRSVTEPPRPGEIWKPNLHAHLVFDWYNHETGKSIKTSKLDAVEMQTICAEVLDMERGVSSDRKHLEAAQYKARKAMQEFDAIKKRAEQEATRAEAEAKTKAAQLNKESGNKLLKGAAETAISLAQGAAKLVGKGKLVEREKAVAEKEREVDQFLKHDLPLKKQALEAEYQAKKNYLKEEYQVMKDKEIVNLKFQLADLANSREMELNIVASIHGENKDYIKNLAAFISRLKTFIQDRSLGDRYMTDDSGAFFKCVRHLMGDLKRSFNESISTIFSLARQILIPSPSEVIRMETAQRTVSKKVAEKLGIGYVEEKVQSYKVSDGLKMNRF